MNILWLLLNNPIISKCLVAGSPFHLLPWHSVLRWDHEDQEFFDRTVPTSPSCRGSLPPKWHGRYSKPHHQSEPEHDDENHPSTPGTGRTPMLQPAPREVIERNLPFLSMTWLKSWRDPRTFLFGECTPTSAPCPADQSPPGSREQMSVFSTILPFLGGFPILAPFSGTPNRFQIRQAAVPPRLASKVRACASAVWKCSPSSCTGEGKSFSNELPKPARNAGTLHARRSSFVGIRQGVGEENLFWGAEAKPSHVATHLVTLELRTISWW